MIFRLKAKKYAAPYLSYHTSCLLLHSDYTRTAILPSNSKRPFPIIMPFNAIRMVIRLQMKYLHDTVVWVRWCGEVRKAASGAFGKGTVAPTRSGPNLKNLLLLHHWVLKGRTGCLRDSCWLLCCEGPPVKCGVGMTIVRKTLFHIPFNLERHTQHIHFVLFYVALLISMIWSRLDWYIPFILNIILNIHHLSHLIALYFWKSSSY